MARKAARPRPTSHQTLVPLTDRCRECGGYLRSDYRNHRTITCLGQILHLHLSIRRCHNPACSRHCQPYRPEAEGSLALPGHEFGLEVIALIGSLRYRQHRSVPEIHQDLLSRGVMICQRTVTNLLDRYDELLAVRLSGSRHLRHVLTQQKRVILALDGLQPDVGHEVLWVLRDCLSGQVLLARSLLSSTEQDVVKLIEQVKRQSPVPITGVISDGQHAIRNAVACALPQVPHQLCHFHYLREAARPIYEADRHAKKELKKQVRGIRPIERQVQERQDQEAQAVRGYCSAVRSAITDDGRPPLQASGLKLHERLRAVSASLDRVEEKRGFPRNSRGSRESWTGDCKRRPTCGPKCSWASIWFIRPPRSSRTRGTAAGRRCRRSIACMYSVWPANLPRPGRWLGRWPTS